MRKYCGTYVFIWWIWTLIIWVKKDVNFDYVKHYLVYFEMNFSRITKLNVNKTAV